jgi:hypothetical protein
LKQSQPHQFQLFRLQSRRHYSRQGISNAGVTFTHKNLNLDLRYYDTNLSKENCFVLTGDLSATPGGSIDPLRNPEGLRSRWCSATFVAKFWFALN